MDMCYHTECVDRGCGVIQLYDMVWVLKIYRFVEENNYDILQHGDGGNIRD